MNGGIPEEADLRISFSFDTLLLFVNGFLFYALCILSPLIGPAARAKDPFGPGGGLVFGAVWLAAFSGSLWAFLRERGNPRWRFWVCVGMLTGLVFLPLFLLLG